MKIISSQAVIDEALTWLGTPCQHMGRTKGLAVDCIGLVLETLKAVGVTHGYEDAPYGRVPNSKLKRLVQAHSIKVWDRDADGIVGRPLDLAREADVALCAWAKEPRHIAFLTRRPGYAWYMIHAYDDVKKVTYHRVDQMWLPRIVGIYRIPGIE